MTDGAFPDARRGSAFGLMRGRPASRSWPPPSVLVTGRAAAPGDRGVAGLVAELEGSDPSWLPLPASVLFVVLEVLVRDTEQALGPREGPRSSRVSRPPLETAPGTWCCRRRKPPTR